MSLLFEYGNWVESRNKSGLKRLLQSIWADRKFDEDNIGPIEESDTRYQPFLQFDDHFIRANNYVGFIQYEDELIEIYPKTFRALENPSKNIMLKHIFFWFSYCRKWRFPFNQVQLDSHEIDKFPELIIYLMAYQFSETVLNNPLQQYQQIEQSLLIPRGSINFNRYLNHSLAKGNYHQIECDYEPFVFDNIVNRIIKYCARLLLEQTQFYENQRLLQEVIFILDEVADTPISIEAINAVKLNSFYSDYILLLEMCKSILNQQLYSSKSYDMSQWCLLFPMEYIFEDFLAGFLAQNFSDDWRVEYQKSDTYLSVNPKAFNLQQDIYLTSRDGSERKIIIDTKYKLRDYKEGDPKKGVSQDDLYQVLSYAYRRGCEEVFLIYPNASEGLRTLDRFEIPSGFAGDNIIKITVCDIPFWSMNNFNGLDESLKLFLGNLLND